jgi:hypothetical protein
MKITIELELPNKLIEKLTEICDLWNTQHKIEPPWTKERICAVILIDVLCNLSNRNHNTILSMTTIHKSIIEIRKAMENNNANNNKL